MNSVLCSCLIDTFRLYSSIPQCVVFSLSCVDQLCFQIFVVFEWWFSLLAMKISALCCHLMRTSGAVQRFLSFVDVSGIVKSTYRC